MAMWLDRLLTNRTTHALELAARFAEHRQQILAENVANIDTPDYHSRRLDPEAFQSSLREALDRSSQAGSKRLDLRGNAQFTTLPNGQPQVRAVKEPAPNVLFHDGTNARVDELMSDVSKNSLYYQMASNLLRGRFDGLMAAIRGRTS